MPWRACALATGGLAGALAAPAAHAQIGYNGSSFSVLVSPAIPDNFDRGRNISVLERARPDFDPLGIQSHSFIVLPRLEVAGGGTSNVYQTSGNGIGAALLSVSPSVRATSDWNRDAVSLYAGATFNRYIDQSRRNEDAYDLRALGRKDVGNDFSLTGEAQYARLYESPESGAIDPTLSVLSSYRRSFLAARAQYQAGRARAILALDRTGFSFDTINAGGGFKINQQTRDRVISRVTGEYQYALTPSISLYAQASYGDINYSRRLANGTRNRDSTGERLVGGVNFDISELVRGKIGVGVINRNFRSSTFKDVTGVSAEAEIEYFPTEQLTLALLLGRTLADADVTSTSVYFDNQALVRADYELLRNLIVGGSAEYRRQTYVGLNATNNYYRASINARYLSSRFVELTSRISYVRRTSSGGFAATLSEVRGLVGIVLHR